MVQALGQNSVFNIGALRGDDHPESNVILL